MFKNLSNSPLGGDIGCGDAWTARRFDSELGWQALHQIEQPGPRMLMFSWSGADDGSLVLGFAPERCGSSSLRAVYGVSYW